MHHEYREIFHSTIDGVRYVLKSDRPLKFKRMWTPRREYFIVRQAELMVWVGEHTEEDAWWVVDWYIVENWLGGNPRFTSLLREIKTH